MISFYFLILTSLSVGILLLVLRTFLELITSPLREIPGPFFAKFSNLWRFLDTYQGRPELTHYRLHEKYGPVVRLGPNICSVNDPKLVKTIYDTRGDFLKSDFYTVNDTKVGKVILKNVFSTQSNEMHSFFLRPISKFYKISHLLLLEGKVHSTINSFCSLIESNFIEGPNADKPCPLDEWLLYFAWDVISQLTFGKPMGFMDEGKDYSGLLRTADEALDYFAVIGQIPWLDHWLAKNPIRPIGPPSFDSAAIFCAQVAMARQQGQDGKEKIGEGKDMLDGFIEVKNSNPELLDDNGIIGALLVNVLAGADTTAILLRSIVYHVLKNPSVYHKLREELDAAALTQPIKYTQAIALPYLDAVIRESGRIHPGVGLLLERVVPESGLHLTDGNFLPAGTLVGINPYVIQRNKSVYGEDSDSFIPERWLKREGEGAESFQSRLAEMKKCDLSFGAGSRSCLGKNITLLETYPVIATLFSKYDISLVDQKKEWKVQNSWFVRQSGVDVRFCRRFSSKA